MRWLVLNLHPAMRSHADPRRSWRKKKTWTEIVRWYIAIFFFYSIWKQLIIRISVLVWNQSKTVTLCATHSPQIRWCHAPWTPLCFAPSLSLSLSFSCISQHMLPLLIYVTVSRTASLSQSSDTTCVCNECVYVACVCVCVSACFFCKREHLCLLYCTCADAGDVMLFVRVSKCVCVRVFGPIWSC